MNRKAFWLSVWVFVFGCAGFLLADDPTSKFVSLAPIASTLAPSSSGLMVQLEIRDQAVGGALIYTEAHTVDTDGSSNITNDTNFADLLLGRPNGLDAVSFPYGSSRYLDVTQGGVSRLTARLPLYASFFSLTSSSVQAASVPVYQDPSASQTISQPSGTGLFVNRLEGIRFADQFTSLQAAHDDLPSTGGVIVVPSGFKDTESATVNISKPNVAIMCLGRGPAAGEIAIDHRDVGLNVTGRAFHIEGCQLSVKSSFDRANIPIIDANVQVGQLFKLNVTGNPTPTVNNGIFFRSLGSGPSAGMWQMQDIILETGKWTAAIFVKNVDRVNTAADFHVRDFIVRWDATFTDAGAVIDGTIDTFMLNHYECCGPPPSLQYPRTPAALHVRNTGINPAPEFPRWVHCEHCLLEAGGSDGTVTAAKFDNGKDLQYQGYVASTPIGISVAAGVLGTIIHDTVFVNIGQSAITYAGDGQIIIHHNDFQDSGNQSNNTYDTISLAPGANGFIIDSNIWRNTTTNKPMYGVNIQAGGSDNYVISGNIYAGASFGAGFLNDGGTGTKKTIMGQDSSVTARLPESLQVSGNLQLDNFTATTGNILKGGIPFIHNFGTGNTLIGLNAGNLTMSGVNNTASGAGALASNTTGMWNTASGTFALPRNTTGQSNTASGFQALFSNTAGGGNTASGVSALSVNTEGSGNTASGVNALLSNNTGNNNTAIGWGALESNTTGSVNTAVGYRANISAGNLTNATAIGANAIVSASNSLVLGNNANVGIGTPSPGAKLHVAGGNVQLDNSTATTGNLLKNGVPFIHNFGTNNTLIGSNAGNLTMSGDGNTASGFSALRNNTTGFSNTASGAVALQNNTIGEQNTASGWSALQNNTSGSLNTATGANALQKNTTGEENTASGWWALQNNTTGMANTATGLEALGLNTTGNFNTACGFKALENNLTGSRNTAIGVGANVSRVNLTNATAIGASAVVNDSNKVRIGNDQVTVIEGQGDFYASGPGNGIILKSPNGVVCRRLGIDNAGALVTTVVACP